MPEAFDPTKWRAPWMDVIDPLTEFFFPEDIAEDPPMTEEEATRYVDQLRAAGVSQEDIDFVIAPLLQRGAPSSVILSNGNALYSSAKDNATIDSTQADVDSIIAEQLGLLDEYQGNLETGRDRYQTLLDDPTALRGDAEYGAYMGQVESNIASAVNQELRRIGADTSSAALRSSGAGDGRISRARIGGATARNSALNSLYGDIQGRRDAYQSRIDAIPTLRSDIQGGRISPTMLFGQTRLDTQPEFDPYGDYFFEFGTEDYDRGARNEGVGRLTSGLESIGDDIGDTFDEWFGND